MLFSAALIVKNEEKFLEQCILSIQDLVDETVIVDTGSTDRSQAIAREYGARLYDFKWRNDFAAARNFALNLARGRWILYIDADERLRPADALQLREKLQDPAFVAYTVQLHPRPASTAYPELRVFRNDPRIRFRGRIHENIWPGIDLYRAQQGGRIGTSGLVFDHEGYEGDQNHKHQRNLPLLKMALREDPDRVFSWCHLASIYAELGKDRNAKKAWKRALSIVSGKKWLRSEDCLPYTGLIQWKLKHRQDPHPLLNEAISRFPANLQLHWLHGKVLMGTGRFEEAIPIFDHIIACGKTGNYDHSIAYDQRLFAELPLSHLAACHFQLKDYAASGHYFELAQKYAPDNLEYRVKRGVCAMLERSNSSADQVSEITLSPN